MKTITIEDAIDLLEQCAAAYDENKWLFFPNTYFLKDESLNIFASFVYENENGDSVDHFFAEGENQSVPLDGCSMTLVNDFGEKVTIHLLIKWEAENFV